MFNIPLHVECGWWWWLVVAVLAGNWLTCSGEREGGLRYQVKERDRDGWSCGVLGVFHDGRREREGLEKGGVDGYGERERGGKKGRKRHWVLILNKVANVTYDLCVTNVICEMRVIDSICNSSVTASNYNS